jgi:hypothetical protein
MEHQNSVQLILSKDCARVVEIQLNVKRIHLDAVIGLLARVMKVSCWGALRFLLRFDGDLVVRDTK